MIFPSTRHDGLHSHTYITTGRRPVCPMVPRDKCSLAHVEVKMGNVFIQFDWPFYGRPEGEKKGCACVHGRVYLLGDRTRVR